MYLLLLFANILCSQKPTENLDYIEKEIKKLYSPRDGFDISKEDKAMMRQSGNDSTYGELTWDGAKKIINDVKNPEVIYDLGSGSGRALLMMCLASTARKCVGIELSKDRVNMANRALNRLKKENPELLKGKQIEFIYGDITKSDFADGDLFFISSLCFPNKILNGIARNMERQVKPGAKVFTTKPLLSNRLVERPDVSLPMTWNSESSNKVYDVK